MAKKNGNGGGFSLRRKDAVSGGGGTEGALATVTEIGFVDEYTYGGTQRDKPAAALQVVYEIDGFKKPWDNHFSVGPSSKYEVIEDGDSIKALGDTPGLNDKCPASLFLGAVEDAAEKSEIDIDELLPEIDGGYNSVAPLRGRRVRLTNIKAKTVGGDEKEYLVIGEFVDDEAPRGRSKSAASNGNGKVANTPSKKSSSADDIEEKTVAAIQELIEEHTSVKVNNLPNLIFDANKKDPDAKAMMQLAFKASWLADDDRPWEFDKKKGLIREQA